MKLHRFYKQMIISIVFILISLLAPGYDADAKVKVVTSTTDFTSIVRQIGGNHVDVESLAKGYQDPHFVDAKPTFITKLNRADLLVYTGLDLEVGWLPVLITGARNSNISAPNVPGHLDVSTSMAKLLEVRNIKIDRSMGDVHPGGNPHYMLNPENGIQAAKEITNRLQTIDPENAPYYEENLNKFTESLSIKIVEWKAKLAPFEGKEIVTYHKLWIYFTHWAELKEAGYIEPKPGIPPTPSHVANLIKQIQSEGIKLIIAANYYPQKTASLIAEKSGATILFLPTMVEGQERINTYIELFDTLVDQITSELKHIERGK